MGRRANAGSGAGGAADQRERSRCWARDSGWLLWVEACECWPACERGARGARRRGEAVLAPALGQLPAATSASRSRLAPPLAHLLTCATCSRTAAACAARLGCALHPALTQRRPPPPRPSPSPSNAVSPHTLTARACSSSPRTLHLATDSLPARRTAMGPPSLRPSLRSRFRMHRRVEHLAWLAVLSAASRTSLLSRANDRHLQIAGTARGRRASVEMVARASRFVSSSSAIVSVPCSVPRLMYLALQISAQRLRFDLARPDLVLEPAIVAATARRLLLRLVRRDL